MKSESLQTPPRRGSITQGFVPTADIIKKSISRSWTISSKEHRLRLIKLKDLQSVSSSYFDRLTLMKILSGLENSLNLSIFLLQIQKTISKSIQVTESTLAFMCRHSALQFIIKRRTVIQILFVWINLHTIVTWISIQIVMSERLPHSEEFYDNRPCPTLTRRIP